MKRKRFWFYTSTAATAAAALVVVVVVAVTAAGKKTFTILSAPQYVFFICVALNFFYSFSFYKYMCVYAIGFDSLSRFSCVLQKKINIPYSPLCSFT